MDGFSLLVGGMLGVLAGWAFSSASAKRREANDKLSRFNEIEEEIDQKKQKARGNEKSRFTDTIQSFFFNAFGFMAILVMGIIFFSSLG